MRSLATHVERGANMVGLPRLIVKKWEPRNVLDLYDAVKHLFAFYTLMHRKKRRFEQLNWKTFFNILSKRKGRLLGEQMADV